MARIVTHNGSVEKPRTTQNANASVEQKAREMVKKASAIGVGRLILMFQGQPHTVSSDEALDTARELLMA